MPLKHPFTDVLKLQPGSFEVSYHMKLLLVIFSDRLVIILINLVSGIKNEPFLLSSGKVKLFETMFPFARTPFHVYVPIDIPLTKAFVGEYNKKQ